MKYTYSEYRQKAWDSLTGKWGAAALLMLVYLAIAGVISALSGGNTDGGSWRAIFLILELAILPMAYVLAVAFLGIAKGEDVPKVTALFDPYKDKDTCLRYFLVEFWKGLFIFLWTLLLIVPGIIKSYAYAMTEYIAAENPDMDARTAMKKSEELMQGHKWDLFVLDLTFIGWLLLSMLTAGLLMLVVQPYIYTAHAHFYLSLKEDLEPEGTTKSESNANPTEEKAEMSSAKAEKTFVAEEPTAEEPTTDTPVDDKPIDADSAEK